MAGRRQLTVSVVPKYGDAIMDGDSDGFPGLIASEIAADDEAAALVEQFVATVSYRPCLLLSLLARPGPGIRARAGVRGVWQCLAHGTVRRRRACSWMFRSRRSR